MDLEIAGKVALVLGGSQGIGRAVARELSREGCAVAVVARRQPGIDAAPFGITVNTIATGPIDTGLFTKFFSARAGETGVSAEDFIGNIVAKVPAGRMGTPEEMAGLCLYLCSNRAGFTTGENILCDGGLMNTPM